MCVVDIKINEALVREINPELNSIPAIRSWAQHILDQYIENMVCEDTATMGIEEARAMTLSAIKEEYAKP